MPTIGTFSGCPIAFFNGVVPTSKQNPFSEEEEEEVGYDELWGDRGLLGHFGDEPPIPIQILVYVKNFTRAASGP